MSQKQQIAQFIQALQQKEYTEASKALKKVLESKLERKIRKVVREGYEPEAKYGTTSSNFDFDEPSDEESNTDNLDYPIDNGLGSGPTTGVLKRQRVCANIVDRLTSEGFSDTDQIIKHVEAELKKSGAFRDDEVLDIVQDYWNSLMSQGKLKDVESGVQAVNDILERFTRDIYYPGHSGVNPDEQI